jgi:hypothetical protein
VQPLPLGHHIRQLCTPTTRCAHEELIEREVLAAETQIVSGLDLVKDRPRWHEGLLATLNWAWRGTAGAPLEVNHPRIG